jgi:hypothetical protein
MEGVLESCCCAFECGAQTAKSVWQGVWSVVHPLRFNKPNKICTEKNPGTNWPHLYLENPSTAGFKI